jgi:hypothetical protein
MPRLVYSLLFETERVPVAEIVEFIIPLDRRGNGGGGLVPIGKPRVVDLRPGDEFLHVETQKRYKRTALRAYRQHQLSDELIAAGTFRRTGTWWPMNDRDDNPYAAPQTPPERPPVPWSVFCRLP